MNHLLVIILLLSYLQLTLSQTCKNSFGFDHSICTFDYQFQGQSCTQFHFTQCRGTQCILWVTIDKISSCSRYQTFYNTDWIYCNKKCCDRSITYPYEYASILQCQEYLNHQFRKNMIIIGSVLGGLLFIGLIILIVCCVKYHGGWAPCLRAFLQLIRLGCRCFRRPRQQAQVAPIIQMQQRQVRPEGEDILAQRRSLDNLGF